MNRSGLLRALLRDAARRIRATGAGNPTLEAEYLLAHALGIDRTRLLLLEGEPDQQSLERFQAMVERRLSREPLQYLLGSVPFCEIDLEIGPGALIPRGETEVLVGEVSRVMREMTPVDDSSGGAGREGMDGQPLLVDVGTGTGAILLALLHRFPDWTGIGIDRSARALLWARRNRDRWCLSRCSLVRGDLLSALRPRSASVVVSNPPYIRTADLAELDPEIRDHEPREALDGGPDGLAPLRGLVEQASRVLRPGGVLAVELAPDQPPTARELAASDGRFTRFRIFHDLAGRRRGLLAWKVG